MIRLIGRCRRLPARRQIVRRFLTTVTLVGVVTCVSGGEPGKDFSITNTTNQTLTVDTRLEYPGQTPAPTEAPGDFTLTLAPGEKAGVSLGRVKGDCLNLALLASDETGHLLYTDPAPVCRDEQGRGNSWTIIAK